MTHFFDRAVLILLAGVALPAYASPSQPVSPPVIEPPAPAAALAAPGVDAAARARHRTRKPATPSTYTVKRGDTLAGIAAKLGVDMDDLAKANRLKSPYRLDVGQTLKNPKAGGESAEAASGRSSGKSSAKSAPESYTVQSGDTLFSIARKFGTSVEDLQKANHLGRSTSIAKGRKLKLPGAGGEESREEAAPEPRSSAHRTPEPEVSERAAPGRIITITTPGKAYKVRRGDNLTTVARKMGADTDDLIRLNHLKKPYRLRTGQVLHGPGGTAKAYVTVRGDTLASVARRFDVSETELRSVNGLRRGAFLPPGRKLRLPAGFHDRGAGGGNEDRGPSTVPSRAPSEGLPQSPQPYAPPSSGGVPAGPVAAPSLSDAQIMQLGRGLFAWPIRGTILSGFGDKGTSQRNDGLNIQANEGDPVRAAASGEVVYAGDQVPGFGNLVLIKHADGWVTAYGHLSRVDVHMQDKVSQGQQIGQAGTTGGVSEPQLHFEIRYAPSPQDRARPIDPTLVLPK